jgi:hypothetical protein
MKHILLAALCLCVPAAGFAGQCFTVYGADNLAAFQSDKSPIDLSRPISEQMKTRFPGHHLVMTQGSGECAEISKPGGDTKPIISIDADKEKATSAAKRSGAKAKRSSAASPAEQSADTASGKPAGDVQVRAHTKSDGTYVQAHTRSGKQ